MDAAYELPVELERAAERFDAQQARWVKLENYGATDYGWGCSAVLWRLRHKLTDDLPPINAKEEPRPDCLGGRDRGSQS